ncbi:phage tail spike protein, partial [Niallia circulans]|uniref:phage tail spike protein n=1 Tax=Niallia circulans TaxID=1397 RepID=UPI000A5DBE80
MSNLLIFDPADNLLAVLSNEAEEACAFWDAPFKEAINQGSTYEFMADGTHEDSKYIIAENQVAFMDKDGAFRLFVIKEPERINGEYGPEIHAICEPAMLELNDEIITDIRPFNTTLRDALTRALNGARWQVGQTSDSFGLNSTNFYYISVTEAIENIVNTWGGEIRDRVEIQGNRIVGRYIDILTMRGTNTGKRWEMDKDILSIRHQVQSYPKTALYGRGASLELEDWDGNATGGYSRKISFADVEWKKAKGDPVDKPKGQEWVGDPEALNIYGRPNKDGTTRHRFGIFESSEQEDPAQLLLETWNALQEQKHPLDNYEMDVFLMEELTGYEHEKVRLGDITVAIDRSFAKPIEAEERVISFEYDVADPEHSGKVELGQFINLYDAEIDNRVDQLERKINDRAGIWDNATKVIDAANGKNKNYSGPIEPVGEFLEGDQWFKVIDGEYTQTYIWNGEGWQLKVDLDVNIAKEEAAEASQRAEDAFNRANEATENAQKAIEDAQTSFDKAQDALDTASAVNSIAVDAVNVANTAKQNAQNALNKASLLESEVETISDDLIVAGGKITTIEQNINSITGELSLTVRTLSDLDGVVSEQQTTITALDEKIELRATKTSVDTLTGRVSDTESNIKSMAGQISLMAKAEDVYTKAQVDSSLKGKVDTSTYTSKMSQIDLSINGITNRVSSTESSINGLNEEINTVKSNIASLDIKADGIISSVSQVQTNLG